MSSPGRMNFIIAAVFAVFTVFVLYTARDWRGYSGVVLGAILTVRRVMTGLAERRAAKLEELAKLTAPK